MPAPEDARQLTIAKDEVILHDAFSMEELEQMQARASGEHVSLLRRSSRFNGSSRAGDGFGGGGRGQRLGGGGSSSAGSAECPIEVDDSSSDVEILE